MAKRTTKAKPKAKPAEEKPAEEKPRTYEDVAQRAVAAFEELNAAMKEAYGCEDMRVFCVRNEGAPMVFQYSIYKLTNSSPIRMKWKVGVGADEKITAEYVGQVKDTLDGIVSGSLATA